MRSRVRFMMAPTSSSVVPPRSATSSAQDSPRSQTSRSGKLSLMAPVRGDTSMNRWCLHETNGHGRGPSAHSARVSRLPVVGLGEQQAPDFELALGHALDADRARSHIALTPRSALFARDFRLQIERQRAVDTERCLGSCFQFDSAFELVFVHGASPLRSLDVAIPFDLIRSPNRVPSTQANQPRLRRRSPTSIET